MRPYKGVHYESIRETPRTWRTINNRGEVLEPTISESQAPKYRSKIEQHGDKITVSLIDENGVLYSRGTFELDGKNFGCAEGQLVIKTFRNSVPPESWAQVLEYSETLIRKETDHSLGVMRMSTGKIRSLTIGQSFKAPQKAIYTWKFERVEK
ncbi:hypothetical protein FACS1894158_17920 [Betaproteobacteria bacterium]|nr:hypothetical protein FACS1894158_17920 [Betaproteobacteria bacterium]